MKKEVSITVRQNPTGVQQVTAEENCECLKKFGGEYDGFLWDNNGIDIIAVKWENCEISETLRIKVNEAHLEQAQLEAIERGYSDLG